MPVPFRVHLRHRLRRLWNHQPDHHLERPAAGMRPARRLRTGPREPDLPGRGLRNGIELEQDADADPRQDRRPLPPVRLQAEGSVPEQRAGLSSGGQELHLPCRGGRAGDLSAVTRRLEVQACGCRFERASVLCPHPCQTGVS